MNKILGAIAAAALTLTAQVASAATTFSFSMLGTTSGVDFEATGFFVADDGTADVGGTVYSIITAGGTLTASNGFARNIIGISNQTTPSGASSLNTLVDDDQLGLLLLGATFALDGLPEDEFAVLSTTLDDVEAQVFTLNALVNLPGGLTEFSAGNIKVNVAAVPEPASWAMMLLGFGAIGVAMRRRRVLVAFAG